MAQNVEPLDLVAIKEAAEKFLAVASADDLDVKEYVDSYNAYTQVVSVGVVLALVEMAK